MPKRSLLPNSRSSMVVLCLILFVTFLDNTIVSVVLSNMQSSLSAGVQDLQWVVNAYMIVFAIFMLTGGTLGDILGRKKILLSGITLFGIGSLIAALAPNIGLLIVGRTVMGLGAAASEPGTLSMIRQLYPQHNKRSKALGIWAAVSGVALAFGPIIGGVIIGFTSWRGVFVFSAILSAITLIMGLIFLTESSDPRGRHFDFMGLVTGAGAICAIAFALIIGESTGYNAWWIVLLFAVSLASLTAFIFIERHQKDPVLPLKFFRSPQFSIANAIAFATNFGIFSVFFFITLYLQLIAGFSGDQIAIAFITMTIAIVVAALVAGRWSASHHLTSLSIVGCLVSGIGVFIINIVISPSVSSETLAWALAISGIGFGISLVTMTSSVLNIMPPQRSGTAASTVNTFRELGGVFGVAVLGSVVNGRLTANLATQLRALHLPANFQAFAIYAITHGGNTPKGVTVNPSILVTHSQLVTQVTNAAYGAFSNGLTIALNITGTMLLSIGVVCTLVYMYRRRLSTKPLNADY